MAEARSNGRKFGRGERQRERGERGKKVNSEQVRDQVVAEGGEVVPANMLRRRIVEYMKLTPRPSDAKVAELLGCARSTVFRVRRALEMRGVEDAVCADMRYKSGRKSEFGPAWLRLIELKQQYKEDGGVELWRRMIHEEGWDELDVPTPARINSRFSELRLVQPPNGGKADKRAYFTEGRQEVLGCVGMDSCWPFVTKMGARLGVVDLRDHFTGLTYVEPYQIGREDPKIDGHHWQLFCGAYHRFCHHIGVPKVVVLDNGGDANTYGGSLPQFVRHAIEMGSIVEFEPPARPYKNPVIERWHRDLQKHWRGIRDEVITVQQGMMMLRRRAQVVNVSWPRKQLGGKSPASMVNYKPFPITGEKAGPGACEKIERAGFTKPGIVRFQRIVEANGAVFLHGDDHLFVSSSLKGNYVRVSCLVEPGTGGGTVTVQDGHGEVVAIGTHHFDVKGRDKDCPLVQVEMVHFTEPKDAFPNMSQDLENRRNERARKMARPAGIYAATGTLPNGHLQLRRR